MTDQELAEQERWVDKVNKLLAKAEGASTEAEAEAFRTKAEQLIVDWGIDDAMLEAAKGLTVDTIESRQLKAYGIFGDAHMRLNYFIGVTGFGFKGFVSKGWGMNDTVGKVMGTTTWVGFKSDLDRAELLITSLHVQLSNELARFTEQWKKEWGTRLPKHELYKSRRAFIEAFGHTVARRLAEVRRQAVKDADSRMQPAATVLGDQPVTSTALVLKNRDEKLNEFFDTKYGKLRSGRATYRGSGVGGSEAGRAAGQRANLGAKGVGSRKAIGR